MVTDLVFTSAQHTAAQHTGDRNLSSSVVVEDELPDVPLVPQLLKQPVRAIGWWIARTYELVCLVLLLAMVSAIPILNLFVLGYFLEAEGRVARTGKLRYGFPLLKRARAIVSLLLGMGFWLLLLWLMAGRAADAEIIAPGSVHSQRLNGMTLVFQWVLVVHLSMAVARGGSLTTFFRPIKNFRWLLAQFWNSGRNSGRRSSIQPAAGGLTCSMCGAKRSATAVLCKQCGEPLRLLSEDAVENPDSSQKSPSQRSTSYWETAAEHVAEFVSGLRIRHHFWLGLRGFAGAMVWLVPPTILYAAASKSEGGAILVTILGGICLVAVFSWLPFLQARMAAENRLRAMFELRAIRDLFKAAPLAWLFSLVMLLVLALPFYLLKIRLFDPGAMWLATLVFVVTIFPARLLTGWAYHRAEHRETSGKERGWFGWAWTARAAMLPVLILFVFLLFFTQGIGAYGKATLFDHHAFLVPLLLS